MTASAKVLSVFIQVETELWFLFVVILIFWFVMLPHSYQSNYSSALRTLEERFPSENPKEEFGRMIFEK